jgi:general secretion pathway protein E
LSSVPRSAARTISAEQLDVAVQTVRGAALAADGGLWAPLLAALATDEDQLVVALQEWQGVGVVTDSQWPQARVLNDVPGLPAGACALVMGTQTLLLCDDPWCPPATQALARRNNGQTQLALAKPGQLRAAHALLPASTVLPRPNGAVATPTSLDDSPIVRFVDAAITRAYADGASDIHFETDRQGISVKYRLDGVMAPGERLPDPQRAEEVISRIKVLAQLDITERRRPQDGRIHWQSATGAGGTAESIDLRVSIMPSIFGEDAVLRLLDKAQLRHTQQAMSLDVLGFDAAVGATIRALAGRPHGMLLITGPTGSGKTTTVYAALSEVNDGLEKIVTIEDPVEYELPGVLQIPVNEQKGLTFATGLRSILRHDPDKILVGEIRDAETAEIAIQSSLTGHLVFTTVHANSLFDVLGRFQHFGIDPFALASALNGVVVQRLLRRLCPHCPEWRGPTDAECAKLVALGLDVPDQLPVPKGCDHCRHTGYRGRFVVAEVHELSDAVRDLIVRKATMTELKTAIYRDDHQRLLAQAVRQVSEGRTTLEEVARVVGLV